MHSPTHADRARLDEQFVQIVVRTLDLDIQVTIARNKKVRVVQLQLARKRIDAFGEMLIEVSAVRR